MSSLNRAHSPGGGRVIACAAILVASAGGCGGMDSSQPQQESVDSEIRCDISGTSPITVYELVEAFRENGIALEVNLRKCRDPDSSHPDATNLGPTGLGGDEAVRGEQGDILCDVFPSGSMRTVRVVRYPEDRETYIGVLNVDCAVYPSDSRREAEQVERVRRAMEHLARDA